MKSCSSSLFIRKKFGVPDLQKTQETKGRRMGTHTRAMFIILSLKRSWGEPEYALNHALQNLRQGCEPSSRCRNE